MTPFLFFLTVAIILIILEIAIFQFTVFWSLFIGLGALVAALAAMIYPNLTWLAAMVIFVFSSVIICIALSQPLKKWQSKPGRQPSHDVVGQRVTVIADITADSPGKVQWSGTDWSAYLSRRDAVALHEGDTAYIESMEGIRLTVTQSKL